MQTYLQKMCGFKNNLRKCGASAVLDQVEGGLLSFL